MQLGIGHVIAETEQLKTGFDCAEHHLIVSPAGMTAAEGMAPGFGFLIVGGLFVMNEYFKKPIVRMAVGPIAVIVVGILINIFAVLGLYSV